MDAKALQIVVRALPAAFPLAGLILDAVTRSQKAVAEAEASGDKSLDAEMKRQQPVMEFQAHMARVAQEVAIAERMAFADEVEIKEYYEGTGKGTAGFNIDGTAAIAGLSGEGRRVTKRVIKLKGTTLAPDADESTHTPLN